MHHELIIRLACLVIGFVLGVLVNIIAVRKEVNRRYESFNKLHYKQTHDED